MLNQNDINIADQIKLIENDQKITMNMINSYLLTIEDVHSEGEESHPELKKLNDKMKKLIYERYELFRQLGIEPKSNLPDGVVHILTTMI